MADTIDGTFTNYFSGFQYLIHVEQETGIL